MPVTVTNALKSGLVGCADHRKSQVKSTPGDPDPEAAAVSAAIKVSTVSSAWPAVWHNKCQKGQEQAVLQEGVAPPSASAVDPEPQPQPRPLLQEGMTYGHQPHVFSMPPNTADQAKQQKRPGATAQTAVLDHSATPAPHPTSSPSTSSAAPIVQLWSQKAVGQIEAVVGPYKLYDTSFETLKESAWLSDEFAEQYLTSGSIDQVETSPASIRAERLEIAGLLMENQGNTLLWTGLKQLEDYQFAEQYLTSGSIDQVETSPASIRAERLEIAGLLMENQGNTDEYCIICSMMDLQSANTTINMILSRTAR
ncbi:UNVERIFIED_CONTAM: hypothetical protein FKN15_000342 [Acipenser sinensis]